MTRRFPERPIVCVGAIVVGPAGVVLVRRGQPPLLGEWSLPGGAIEIGEATADAVRREVREETGLEVEVGPLLDVFDRVHLDGEGRVEYHYVLLDYLCRSAGGTLTCGSDAADARWVRQADLPAYALPDAARAVVAKGLEFASRPS